MTDKNPIPPTSPDTDFTDQWPLDLSEYLKFDDDQWPDDDPEPFISEHVMNQHNQQSNELVVGGFGESGSQIEGSSSRGVINEDEKVGEKVAFKTKSVVEILDDGFKWRKYGKKMVKNSPNPRNYYRCSTDGCQVKKRVERDVDDPSYVITTYEGTHTHPSFR